MMPSSSIQTDDSWGACPVVLPTPDVVVSQLHGIFVKPDANIYGANVALKSLLERHPAFAQLLAKSPELRSVIENGAEELLPQSLDTSNGVASSHVMWTLCTCIWQGISVLLESLSRKFPGDVASASEQLRFLMQSNNDLRSQLANCRRDYLRELTELRERCRRIDPHDEEALRQLLQEEPVMFFEPLDFVFEDTTKQFIRDTVEEKLRLLMLKGLGKGSKRKADCEKVDKIEADASASRLRELEAELAILRARCDVDPRLEPASCAEKDGDDCGKQDLQFDRPDAERSEDPNLAGSSKQLEALPAVDLESLCASEVDEDLASTRCSTATARDEIPSTRCSTAMSSSAEVDSWHGLSPTNSASTLNSASVTNPEVPISSCRTCMALRSKLASLCLYLKRSVGSEVVKDAIAKAGLTEDVVKQWKKRPTKSKQEESAFDRLYADAQRREARSPAGAMQKIFEKLEEVHGLQEAELARSSLVASEMGSASTLKSLKALHAKCAASTSALQEAFGALHADVVESSSAEAAHHDVKSEPLRGAVYAPQACSQEIPSSGTGSPERRRLFARANSGNKPVRQAPLRLVQQSRPTYFPEPRVMEEDVASIWKDRLMNQDGQYGASSFSNAAAMKSPAQSISPEKKKRFPGRGLCEDDPQVSSSCSPKKVRKASIPSLYSENVGRNQTPEPSQSRSPQKKKRPGPVTSFCGEHPNVLHSEISQSCSPEKKRTVAPLTPSGEHCIYLKSETPSSSSPEKKNKRGAHLEPLRHEPRPIASLCERSSGPMSVTGDRIFPADWRREVGASASFRCSTPTSFRISEAREERNGTCIAGIAMALGGHKSDVQGEFKGLKEQDEGQFIMRKSESLPTL